MDMNCSVITIFTSQITTYKNRVFFFVWIYFFNKYFLEAPDLGAGENSGEWCEVLAS